MPTTRFGLEGFGVRRAGAFDGKSAAAVVLVLQVNPKYDKASYARLFDIPCTARVFSVEARARLFSVEVSV